MDEEKDRFDVERGATQVPSSDDPAVADTARGAPQPAARDRAADSLSRGTLVGRYVVLSKLGAGAMGVVYVAYDPELDRRIALKLLQVGPDGSEGRGRLLREAQALAKLAHPNVVTIHDVGTREGRVWMAMEYVEGDTFADWLGRCERRWEEIVEALISAGRGVAAAHAEGVLHRDLKPDNIMVDARDRVRVMDFGLARPRDQSEGEADGGPAVLETLENLAQPALAALELKLTQSGALVGTPAYMAPEQFRGRGLGPAVDQFALCATVWEAVYGARPFAGERLVDLAANVLAGRISAPPRCPGVPRTLRRVLERGLAADAEARFSSLEALLDALGDILRRHKRARRARWIVGAAIVVGLSFGGYAGTQAFAEQSRIAACEAEGETISEVWNEERRERLESTLATADMAGAEVTARHTVSRLDAYAKTWQSARTEACLSSDTEDSWDDEVYERALWCLDERRIGLEALIDQLARGGAAAATFAVQAAARLEPVDICHNVAALSRMQSPPAGKHAEVRSIRAELSKASALSEVGAVKEGLAAARDAQTRAEALDWPPLAARARLEVGWHLHQKGSYSEAEEAMEAAYFDAAREGAAMTALWAAEDLVEIMTALGRHRDSLRWSRHAEVILGSLAAPPEVLRARHLLLRCQILWSLGAYDEAQAICGRALTLAKAALGPNHPTVADHLAAIALVEWRSGAYEQAKDRLELTLSIQEAALGAQHTDVAGAANNLAILHWQLGEYGRAKALYGRALAIWEEAFGPDHPDVALALSNLAEVHYTTGSYDVSRDLYERAIEIEERELGRDHPNLAISLVGLADVHRVTGGYEEARALYDRALAIQEEALSTEHPDVATTLIGLARLALAEGRPADAEARAEVALAIRERNDVSARKLAGAQFVLARALWQGPGPRARALDLAEAAREGFRDAGAAGAGELAKVLEWLRSRR